MVQSGTFLAGRQLRLGFVLSMLVVVWLLLGKLVIPGLVGDILPSLGIIQGHDRIRAYLRLADYLVNVIAVGLVAFAFVGFTISRASFYQRFVGPATPLDLGAIRAFVGAWMVGSAIWEDPASTALLPRKLADPLGVMNIIYVIPGFELLAHNATALHVLHGLTIITLLMVTVGFKTRLVLPFAVLFYMIQSGLMRQYSWYWHQGLIPLYVLVALCFTPCDRGLSVDRWLKQRRGEYVAPERPAPIYGWSRYACWVMIAIPYLAAGTNKVRIGGLEWFNPTSMRHFVYRDTLNHSGFSWNLGLDVAGMPDAFFLLLQLCAVFGEAGHVLVLFFPWARWIFPATTAGMHTGIWALQHILFLDLILIQAIFIDWRAVARFVRRLPALRAIVPAPPELPQPIVAPPTARLHKYAGLFVAALTAVMASAYIFRIEFFPFTAVQMYTNPKTSTEIPYYVVHAQLESGATIRGEQVVAESIHALADGRSRRLISYCFQKDRDEVCEGVLRTSAEIYNRDAAPGQRITSFDVQSWRWDFATQPVSAQPGQLVDTRNVPASAASR